MSKTIKLISLLGFFSIFPYHVACADRTIELQKGEQLRVLCASPWSKKPILVSDSTSMNESDSTISFSCHVLNSFQVEKAGNTEDFNLQEKFIVHCPFPHKNTKIPFEQTTALEIPKHMKILQRIIRCGS